MTATLGECEFLLISELKAQLICHHPFRPLKELQQILGLSEDDVNLASSFINDHYATNLTFLYPPHVIAAAAVSAVLTLRPGPGGASASTLVTRNTQSASSMTTQTQTSVQSKARRLKHWLIKSDIDLEGIIDCVQELVSLYVVTEQYSEKDCRDQINRFVKERKLDR